MATSALLRVLSHAGGKNDEEGPFQVLDNTEIRDDTKKPTKFDCNRLNAIVIPNDCFLFGSQVAFCIGTEAS